MELLLELSKKYLDNLSKLVPLQRVTIYFLCVLCINYFIYDNQLEKWSLGDSIFKSDISFWNYLGNRNLRGIFSPEDGLLVSAHLNVYFTAIIFCIVNNYVFKYIKSGFFDVVKLTGRFEVLAASYTEHTDQYTDYESETKKKIIDFFERKVKKISKKITNYYFLTEGLVAVALVNFISLFTTVNRGLFEGCISLIVVLCLIVYTLWISTRLYIANLFPVLVHLSTLKGFPIEFGAEFEGDE